MDKEKYINEITIIISKKKMNSLKKFLILFAVILLGNFAYIRSEKPITDLTTSNIESEVLKSKFGFIMFYSIDCRHCQAIDPIYEETARDFMSIMSKQDESLSESDRLMKTKLEGLNFYKLNSKTNPELMIKYKIDSVPTIVWFNNVKDHYKVYDSETEMPSYFYKFAMENVEFEVPNVNMDQLVSMSKDKEFEGKNVMLFVGDIEKHMFVYKNLMNSAWNMGYKHLFQTNDENIRNLYKIDSNPQKYDVLVFKAKEKKMYMEQFEKMNLSDFDFIDFDSSQTTNHLMSGKYNSNFDLSKAHPVKKIETLLKLFSLYPVNRFTHENEKMITRGIPTLTLVHDFDWDSGEYTEMMNAFTRAAMKYRREIFFMLATKYTKLSQVFTESFRLYKQDLPALCMTSISNEKQSNIDKYRKITKGDSFSESDIVQFIENWKSMNLANFVASEDLPEQSQDENNIHKLVADNFKSKVEDQGKYILLTMCSDRLDICVKFHERLVRVANKLKNSDKIMIAEMNPYTNEIDTFEIQYIPSIYLIPDRGDKLKNFTQYKGRLTTREIIRWIRENTNLGEFEETTLPIEDVLMKEEDLNELKPIDLEVKGMSRKVYEKMIDPVQKEMWVFPNKEEAKKEEEVFEIFFYNFFMNKTKDEL